nr:active breakpoint cluster region [Hymenolepis microstoma]
MTDRSKSKDHEIIHQSSDIDELDSDNSSVDSISLVSYLNINTDSEESQLNKDVLNTDAQIVQVGDASVRTRSHVQKLVDNRKNRQTRELRKQKTLSDYLYEAVSDQEEDNKTPRDSVHSKYNTIVPQGVHKASDGEVNSLSRISVETEFKYMLAYETQNFQYLVEVFGEKKSILSALGKHNFANVFDMLDQLHASQGWIVSYLENICNNNKSQSVEELMNKLCERQKILSEYSQLLQPRLQSTSVKLQCKASSTCQRYLEMLKKPTQWPSETLERIKRVESYMEKNDPNFEIIKIAREELLDTSGSLVTGKQVKEPIKYAILVELPSDSNSERKLVSVFLFDNALVCARQRVITLHKRYTQDSEIEMASVSTDVKDQSGFVMNAKSITRYELKWFVLLNQIQSLETTGVAFDENSLRERLKAIEKLKGDIVVARQKLQEEMNKMEKESKRNKLKYPKIRRLRSQIHSLQADLILQAPKLPLFINTTDRQSYCLLMSSEKERIVWKSAILQAKANYHPQVKYRSPTPLLKPNSSTKSLSSVFRDSRRKSDSPVRVREDSEAESNDSLKNEFSYIINHCEQIASLNKLGKVVLSGSALSGILEVCIHEVLGLTESDSYYIAIEVDFYGQFELVAKTKSISNTMSPIWNQTFILELDTSQTICFTLFRHSTAIGQLEFPLEIDHLDQKNESFNLIALEDATKPISLKLSISYNEGSKMRRHEDSKNQLNMFGLTLTEVLSQDQANLDLLQRKLSNERRYEKLRVPVLVTTCVEEIERRGLLEVGIYRTSGTTTAIAFLKDQFDEDTTLAAKQIGDYDINVVSGLLKLFFRNLSTPLIPNDVMNALVKASAIEDEKEKMSEFSTALKTLPSANLDTFRYLLDHFMRVCQHEEQNKMNAGNLSLIWGMTLFQPDATSAPLRIGVGDPTEIDAASLQSVQKATSNSMLQNTILNTILVSYAAGKLDLSNKLIAHL